MKKERDDKYEKRKIKNGSDHVFVSRRTIIISIKNSNNSNSYKFIATLDFINLSLL